MSEPQDHRLELPWRIREDSERAIWTEPSIPGAAPLLVITSDNLIPTLSEYLVRLHNDRLRYRNTLADSSASADRYISSNGPLPHEKPADSVRRAYLDGYNDGWQQADAGGEGEYDGLTRQVASLKAQVEAA